ncbi:hypothetical protein B0H12DRAFT_1080326 [Mycena haematopus]|nr:hypothetical protein B0H12DRAFT_1080326 [Mycena haematopus]
MKSSLLIAPLIAHLHPSLHPPPTLLVVGCCWSWVVARGRDSQRGKLMGSAQHGETYFITTNVDYVPAVPSLTLPRAVFLRPDMRYGTDDPTLWPQQWSAHHCHLAMIPQRGARHALDVMWWDPSPADFVVGSALTPGLGTLNPRRMTPFLPPINDLIARCETLKLTSRVPLPYLLGELMNNVVMWAEQIQTLPLHTTRWSLESPRSSAETLTTGLYNWNIQVLYATHNTNNTLQSTCGFGVLFQYRLWQFGLSSCTRKRIERQESGFYNNMVVVEGFWRNTPQERLSFKSKFRANVIRE